MLANFKVLGNEQSGRITIDLSNGRQIVGILNGSDKVDLITNTTNFTDEKARIAASIAWILQSEGEVSVVWRKFEAQVDKTERHMKDAALRVN